MQSTPHIDGMMKTKNMGQHILREGIDKKTDHLLIFGDPSIIGRVWNRNFLLILIFSLQSFRWGDISSFKKSHDPSTA
jgi:hypothetical protein